MRFTRNALVAALVASLSVAIWAQPVLAGVPVSKGTTDTTGGSAAGNKGTIGFDTGNTHVYTWSGSGGSGTYVMVWDSTTDQYMLQVGGQTVLWMEFSNNPSPPPSQYFSTYTTSSHTTLIGSGSFYKK